MASMGKANTGRSFLNRSGVPDWVKDYAGLLTASGILFALIIASGGSNAQLDVLCRIMCFMIAAMGLNLVAGYTGQASLGHAGFFALGGYAAGLFFGRVTGSPNWIDYLYVRPAGSSAEAERAARQGALDRLNDNLNIVLIVVAVLTVGLSAWFYLRWQHVKRTDGKAEAHFWNNPAIMRVIFIGVTAVGALAALALLIQGIAADSHNYTLFGLVAVLTGVASYLSYSRWKRAEANRGLLRASFWDMPGPVRRLFLAAAIGGGLATVLVLLFRFVGLNILQNFWASLIVGGAIAAAFGYILALPALRVKGPYLAMVSIAFGFIVVELLKSVTFQPIFGSTGGLDRIPFPMSNRNEAGIFVRDESEKTGHFLLTGLVILAFLMITMYIVRNFIRTRWGRAFIAVRENEIGAGSVGINVTNIKTLAFVMSAAITGVAGVLKAQSISIISYEDSVLTISVDLLTMLILGGLGTLYGPIIGAAIIAYLPEFLKSIPKTDQASVVNTGDIIFLAAFVAFIVIGVFTPKRFRRLPFVAAAVIFIFNIPNLFRIFRGVFTGNTGSDFTPAITAPTITGAILLFALYLVPEGIGGVAVRYLNRFLPSRHTINYSTIAADATATASADAGTPDSTAKRPRLAFHRDRAEHAEVLNLSEVTRDFKGLRAVDNVSLKLERGDIHALIGPNGAGKTTVLNLISGLYPVSKGQILLRGERVDGLKSHRIAKIGISRTFQNLQVFGDMSVIENVMVGFHLHTRQGFWASLLGLPTVKRENERIKALSMELLDFVGLADRAYDKAKDLPYGYQRLLEIARALAVEPEILLLDEPAAGLNPHEIGDMERLIRKIKTEGVTVLLIEHHMDLVMEISDTITVLDYGRKIAQGDPGIVQNDQKVKDAYFGPEVIIDART